MFQNPNLKAGIHINFGQGDYEDYSEFGEREVLKDFNITEQAKFYLDYHNGSKDDPISIWEFLEWLDEQGFTKLYKIFTFYTGSGFYDGEDFDWFGNYTSEQVLEHMENFEDSFNESDEDFC